MFIVYKHIGIFKQTVMAVEEESEARELVSILVEKEARADIIQNATPLTDAVRNASLLFGFKQELILETA